MCPSLKNKFPRNRKKSLIRKNKLPQKFRATRYTHLAYLGGRGGGGGIDHQ